MIRKVDPLISLPATDVPRAVTFYTQVLGLKTLFESDDKDFYIFQANKGETLLGLHGHKSPLAPPDPAGIWIWLWVNQLETLRQQFEKQGVRFVGETTYLGPGHEAPFLDTEGNVLRLYEPLQGVRRTVSIKAKPEAVFAALADAKEIARWFTTIHSIQLEPRTGGHIAFVDPLFGQVEGRVVAFSPPCELVFEFTQNWPERLEFKLTPEGNATRLELHQSGFDPIRDRDFNIGTLVTNLEVALEALAKHIRQASVP